MGMSWRIHDAKWKNDSRAKCAEQLRKSSSIRTKSILLQAEEEGAPLLSSNNDKIACSDEHSGEEARGEEIEVC